MERWHLPAHAVTLNLFPFARICWPIVDEIHEL